MEKISSCVVTVFNEEESIVLLLNALVAQTIVPSEIIFVDAGSTDKTQEIIQSFSKKYKNSNIKLFIKKGNRAVGRNFGITKSKGKIILVADAGCIPDKNWVKNLLRNFKGNVDVVSGFYYSGARTPFTQSAAAYTCVMEEKVNPLDFLPSSRSIAFKKSIWKKVGGYPEYLDTCEDLVFSRNLKKTGAQFVFERKAFVIWPQETNIISAFNQLYGYAVGDGQALYIRAQTPLLFGRYLVGIILLVLCIFYESMHLLLFLIVGLLLYLSWAVLKNKRFVESQRAYFYLPLLQLTSDIAVILGMVKGFMRRLVIEDKTNAAAAKSFR